ncbi:NAD-dependent epimerase/dehydratase family protein [Flavobacterium amniphilum]|uniref:NAD-dependent epimerase/dehydratase family protein n=1 Tax=Flavobacterium amniphilum TaxID=1834035 RepID=UPI00202AB203|nr:NAD-dependent epimerase/dehydratase family protein [Flavobacterium amniphilum]MCL9806037.1 NAD-dependent epimerase/dehydratase family protein [Flavobacterium amniphilum]
MILVTGATGLVGSHLVLQLVSQNLQVRALFRKEEARKRVLQVFSFYEKPDLYDKIEWVQADILDVPSLEAVFENVDQVYHCAALISFDPKDEEKLRKANIEGTANIVNLCIDFGVKKLCHVSSIAALGDLKDFESVTTEETEWNPEVHHNDYAISKYGAEMEVWRGHQEGLQVVVVNPGVILGPVFWTEGSGEIYDRVRKGLVFYTKGGSGFVTVDDVVNSMINLMQSEINGERFILVSETITYQDLTCLIAEKLKVNLPKIQAKKWMTELAWRLDYLLALFGKKRTLSKSMARTLHTIEYYDNSKVKKNTGTEFVKIADYLNG